MEYLIRKATLEDQSSIQQLIRRLSEFDYPPHRTPEDIWLDEEKKFLQWIEGDQSELHVHVAESENRVVGAAISSPREEILSHMPSWHLSMLAVDQSAVGNGIGKALLKTVEDQARANGAQSLGLFVFSNNQKARQLYQAMGFDGELMRYFKPLG